MRGARPRLRSVLVVVAALLLAPAAELAAGGGRGGGGRGGGGFSRGGGGFSRGGAARGGSIEGYDRSRAGSGAWSGDNASRPAKSTRSPSQGGAPGSTSRDGSFENRRGETVDWSSSTTRTEDGIQHEGSWESTSGASGSGSSNARIEDGKLQGGDRSRHVESAQGETLDREVSSQRKGDSVEREGSLETSTGIDADSAGTIKKTDDGFVAQGAVSGKNGAAAGTIVKDGNQVYARGAATDGDKVTWGRAHCNSGTCTGGRVTADIDHYYHQPYYYYPYYYGWYSCPYGSVQTWHGAYGTPIYGCSNVTVVHTTIALGPSSSDASKSGGGTGSREAQVTSAPVLMYEIDPQVVVYATSYEPVGVYSVEQGTRFYWAPGPSQKAADAKKWIEQAGAMPAPTANATVITYTIGKQLVYLTNEAPAPGFFSEPSDQLFAWIPGVRKPSDEERDAIRSAITAQDAGGRAALDREARKLEKNREPPPASDAQPAS